MHKYAILSSNSNPTYSLFAPITALLWKNYIGYEPVLIYCQTADNQVSKLAYSAAKEVGCQIIDLPMFKDPSIASAHLVQIARVFISPFFNDDDYLLTGDIDMWPLSKEWFNKQDPTQAIHLFFSNAYNHEKYPICYIGTVAKIWQDIMQLDKSKTYTPVELVDTIETLIKACLGENPNGNDLWNFDEYIFGTRLKHYSGYPGVCQMFPRLGSRHGFVSGRVDRGRWIFSGPEEGLIDAHCLRPLWTDENWARLRPLLEMVMTNEDLSYVDNYYSLIKKEISNG